ncbi:MAG: sulfotransferase domain-containing protein [Cyanobacteriota bacterium]|nr:sulfotransferase domain-containing protein [Cyanobacteriota bacterium]
MSFSSKFVEKTLELNFHQDWEQKNALFIKEPHAFLSSFPRSGNGWLRLVLAASLLGLTKEVDISSIELIRKATENGVPFVCLNSGSHNYDLEDIFPDIYHMKPEAHYELMSADVKSLNIATKLIKTHHIVDCKDRKTIFLFREPLSCLTSAALLLNKEEIDANPERVNETMVYLLKFYDRMLSHYLEQHSNHPGNCIFIHHQSITNQPIPDIIRIFDFLKIKADRNVIEQVVKEFPFKSGYDKTVKEFISESTKSYIKESIQKNYYKAVQLSSR